MKPSSIYRASKWYNLPRGFAPLVENVTLEEALDAVQIIWEQGGYASIWKKGELKAIANTVDDHDLFARRATAQQEKDGE